MLFVEEIPYLQLVGCSKVQKDVSTSFFTHLTVLRNGLKLDSFQFHWKNVLVL